MNNLANTHSVNFHNDTVFALEHEGVAYVAMRPICENIGIDWDTQSRKLNRNKDKFSCCHMTATGADGKQYQMLCLPLKKLNGWLFSINPEKVRPDIKDKIVMYQEECFEVLYNYFNQPASSKDMAFDKFVQLHKLLNQHCSVLKRDPAITPEAKTADNKLYNAVNEISELLDLPDAEVVEGLDDQDNSRQMVLFNTYKH